MNSESYVSMHHGIEFFESRAVKPIAMPPRYSHLHGYALPRFAFYVPKMQDALMFVILQPAKFLYDSHASDPEI